MTHLQTLSAGHPSPESTAPGSELSLTLLGPSSAMAQLWAQIRRLAPYARTVLLSGEPDCGQEAVARLLFDLSPHTQRSFLHLTAAEAETRLLRPTGLLSLPMDIFLFLPDVHRFSPAAQESLLRLMRTRRSRPFTVVAASAEDLRSLVGMGRFSTELANALHAVRLALPSLKERSEDLPMLVNHLLAAHALEAGRPVPQVTEEFLRSAMHYRWPGNLRELSQTLACVCSEARHGELRAADLHAALSLSHEAARRPQAAARLVPIDTVVQEHISAVLRACGGNKQRASEVLGISRSTLYRMLDAAGQTAALSMAN